MSLQSTISKIIVAVFAIIVVFLALDVVFFQALNTKALVTAILTAVSINPVLSWGIIIVIVALSFFIIILLFYRRRLFIGELKNELEKAERISLIELAQKLDETPAKIEVELNRMASSKVTKFQGLLLITQGKHVYLGQKLLDEIAESYHDEKPRGDIANTLQISRDELDKAIDYLLEKRIIEEREEKTTQKVRPSYRRGTR